MIRIALSVVTHVKIRNVLSAHVTIRNVLTVDIDVSIPTLLSVAIIVTIRNVTCVIEKETCTMY